MMTETKTEVRVEEKSDDAMKFTQEDGLKKTYAHYLLFKEDSPTLDIVIDKLTQDVKFKKFFHTSDKSLFKTLLGIRNKEHIRAALDVFGVGIKEPNRSFGNLDIKKYAEMSAYAKLNLDYFIKYAKEMKENAPMVNLIHELVINYYPVDAGVNDNDKGILKDARDNLQKSLKDGYYKGSEFIDKNFAKTPTPADLDALGKLDIFKNGGVDLIAKAEKHFEQYSNLDRNLSAVASLYADAHWVDVGQALQVVATAHANSNITIDSTMSYSDLLRMFTTAYTKLDHNTMASVYNAIKTKYDSVKPSDNDTLYGIREVFKISSDDTIVDVNDDVKVDKNNIFKNGSDTFMVPPINSNNSCWLNSVLTSVIVPIFIQCEYKFDALIKKINMDVPIFSFFIYQYMGIIFNQKVRNKYNVITNIKKCIIANCNYPEPVYETTKDKAGKTVYAMEEDRNGNIVRKALKNNDKNKSIVFKDSIRGYDHFHTLNEAFNGIPYSELFNTGQQFKVVVYGNDKVSIDNNIILVGEEHFEVTQQINVINFLVKETPTINDVFFNNEFFTINGTRYSLQSIIFGSGSHFITQVKCGNDAFIIDDLVANITKSTFKTCPARYEYCVFVYIKDKIDDNASDIKVPERPDIGLLKNHIARLECPSSDIKKGKTEVINEGDIDNIGVKLAGGFKRSAHKTKKRGGRLHMKTHRRK